MTEKETDNPWNINSIYQLQYFNCPSCSFKNQSSQEFVNHAYELHPESIEYLMNINDESIANVTFPWNEPQIHIKTEHPEIPEEGMENVQTEDPILGENEYDIFPYFIL